MTADRDTTRRTPLLAAVLTFAVLTVSYVVVNRSTPHPDASGAEVLRHARTHASTVELGAFLLFASAVPLALAAAVLHRRLRALGSAGPGAAITLVGGAVAASALTGSAMFAWSGGRLPENAGSALARTLADLSFLSGGPLYAVMFALLVAGVSLAGLLPRALTGIGLALAAVGMVSTLTLLSDGFGYLLPVVRFGGLIWLVFAAALLPRTGRPDASDASDA
ncbi:DUF4386 domain-containing protein [Streptomyces sp. NPDC057136]|uniref:DUF4386 domain-containing protein n=1 Tax=Streptomyces sp. NPDC057136 TaxID=3346029 RepID=UPI0036333EB7